MLSVKNGALCFFDFAAGLSDISFSISIISMLVIFSQKVTGFKSLRIFECEIGLADIDGNGINGICFIGILDSIKVSSDSSNFELSTI